MDKKIHELQTQPPTAIWNVPDIPSVFILSRKAIKLFNISFFTPKSNIKIFLQTWKKVLSNIYSDERDIIQDTSDYYSFYSLRLFGVIRSRVMAPLILNLETRWRWVVKMTHRPFYHRKAFPVPIELKSGWVWTIWRREKHFTPNGIRNNGSSSLSPRC
jgi:hypothetical protein